MQARGTRRTHDDAAEAFCSSLKNIERRDRTVQKSGKVGYDGEVVREVEPLVWEYIEAALPPVGIGGKFEAVRLASPGVRYLLEHSSVVLRSQPDPIPSARIIAAPSEWGKLRKGLVDRGVCCLIDVDAVFSIKGQARRYLTERSA